MEATFELHRTDDRLFEDGEGDRVFKNAVTQTRYPILVKSVTQTNGSVVGTIKLLGTQQHYRIQLVLEALKKVPGIRLEYQGTTD